jgi:hypothetical protein
MIGAISNVVSGFADADVQRTEMCFSIIILQTLQK